MEEIMHKKNIYKKTLAIELIKRGHNFLHSMRNRKDERYQVYVFEHTPKLSKDLAFLTNTPFNPMTMTEGPSIAEYIRL